MKRDFSRESLPKGGLWNAIDVVPNLKGQLRERGGWGNASDDIAATTVTASYVIGGIYAPFAAAAKHVVFDEDGELYTIAPAGTVTDVGASRTIRQNPVFHRDKVIICDDDGTTAPQKYDGSTIALLGGSPPAAIYSTVFNDRTILANTSANANRMWFSGAGSPESWDTTNSYWDFINPITGLASMRGAIIVFHKSQFSTLVGSTPPTVAGGTGDFRANDPMYDVGCTDARSIAYWGDKVIFANPGGIYYTDGATYDDLTALCGVKQYWIDLAVQDTYTISGGILRDHYFICVMDGTTVVDAAMINLRRLSFWRLSNVDAWAMWRSMAAAEELYFGRRGAARVGKLASVFSPASGVKNDGDGDAVASVVETPYYRGDSKRRWKAVYSAHYLQDYATDNPTVTVGYVKTPEDESYTSISTTFSENTAEERKSLPLRLAAHGVGLKLTRANAGDFRLNGLWSDSQPMEQSTP